MLLSKLTTRYIEDEDRFLVSAESEVGVVNLWFTQRLLVRLVPHLIKALEGNKDVADSRQQAPVSRKVKSESATKVDADVDAIATQVAARHRKPLQQVKASDAVVNHLVRQVSFQSSGVDIRLAFDLPNDKAILQLQEANLRIWLDVLCKHWIKAGWPDIWPAWVKKAQNMAALSPAQLTH